MTDPRGASRTFFCSPARALRPYVERFWGWEEARTLQLPLLTPGLGAEVFFHHGRLLRAQTNTSETELARGHLLCVRRVPLRLQPQADVGFTVVRIRAGALGRFTAIPLAELADTHLSAAELWGREGAVLVERVAESSTSAERVRLIEQFLLQRLAQHKGDAVAERALQLIYRRPATLSIDSVAEQCGLSRRQLERRVSTYFGQSPIELRRTARFYRTARRLALEPSLDLLQSALDCGYYDQSHFIREFSRFTGMAPRSFQRASAQLSHFYNPSVSARP